MSFLSQPIQLIPIQPKRTIGTINAQVVITENTSDVLTVTKQPVQQGASITDNSFLEPTVFSCTWYLKDNSLTSLTGVSQDQVSTSGLGKIYQQFLTLQATRVPFNIVTPKRIYNTMLMTQLSQITDKNTENILALNMSFQQIIIVTVSTANIPRTNQEKSSTGATQNAGQKNESALSKLKNAVIGALSK